MAKQLNVKLGFEADVSKARQEIAKLQKSLDNLMSNSMENSILNGFDQEISNAQQSILKLKTAINNSLNADTGRLDLSKFNQQLNNSDLTLSKLAKDMNLMGSDGQKAFLNLANNIITAQKPMRETNKLLDGMWTALKNTARWQISSSILHGFMGALSGAYGYAQDLNKSLNNIRIVTGQSTEQMAKFAEQANKSAQALSVSTTGYTDAALIYYQQGLSDEEVRQRTDVTMKMSNVTGESAEQVSSYMTAIWNNFDNGSESLEHYADVITALGAATASSSEEIANGMQQFAAVAETVGLSYDYAATALATVVAQTRQSESTVGNAFRTIFSRLESLSLGESLEDGTDLTKYSKALETIGVNIKDQNGELKNMDTILDEIGEKWQVLSRDQQIALAQTVGGVRQYANLIALFDNWDTFQENLSVARDSKGALQEQANIYAESWEAAGKRVRAAWQAIYQDLINDKFFITLLNGFEKILSGVDGFIDSIGGLSGVLSGFAALVTSLFEQKITAGIQSAQEQLKYFKLPFGLSGSSIAEAENDAMAIWVKQNLNKQRPEGDVQTQTVESVEIDAAKQRLALTIELKDVYDQLTDSQKEYANKLLESVEAQQKLTIEAKKAEEVAKNNVEDLVRKLRSSAVFAGNDKKITSYFSTGELDEEIARLGELEKGTEKWQQQYDFLINSFRSAAQPTKKQQELIVAIVDAKIAAAEATKKFKKAQEDSDGEIEQFNQRLQELVQGHHNGYLSTNELVEALENEKRKLEEQKAELDKAGESTAEYTQKIKALENAIKKVQQYNKGIFSPEFAKGLTSAANGISKISMGINTLISAWDTLNNKDATFLQKFSAVAMTLSLGLPAISSGIKALGTAFVSFGLATNEAAAATMTFTTALTGTALGPIIIAVGALAGAWYAFDKIVYTSEERLADSNKRLEEAREALSNAETAAQQTSDAYQKLVDTLDGFDSKKDAINQLIEGTTEWKEAIADSNSELLTALEMSGQLSQAKLSYGKGGLISVDNADELKSNARSDSIAADIGVALSKINVSNEENSHALIEAVNEIRNLNDHEAYQRGDISYEQLIDYNKNIGRQSDEELLNTVENWAQQIVDNGYAGQDLTKKLIEDSNGQLTFLEEIKDRKDVLQAIQKAADQIANADKESDAYKKEVGRMAADAAGYDTSNMSGSALENFYLKLYESLQSQVQAEWDEMDQKQQLKYFAEGSGGKYKYDEATNELIETASSKIIESSEIAQSEIKTLGQAALIEEKASAAEAQDLIKYQTEAIRKQQQELSLKVSNNFGDQLTRENASTYSDKMDKWSSEQMNFAIQADMSQFETIEEFIKYVEDSCKEEHHIEVDIDADDLSNFSGKTEDLEAEVYELSKYIRDNIDELEGMSQHLADCADEANKVAYAMIRFDDAMQDIADNYDEWKEALGTNDIIANHKAVLELQKAYGNLFDIDGNQLSHSFISSAENLELFNQVLHGTDEEAAAAYEELARLATINIMQNLNPDLLDSELNMMLANVTSAMNQVEAELGRPLNVGDEIHSEALEKSLNEILASCAETTEEAAAILGTLGYEAEFVPGEADIESEKTVTGYEAIPEPVSDTWTNRGFTPDGQPLENKGNITAEGLRYRVRDPITIKDEEVRNFGAVKIKPGTLHKAIGGNIKINNSPVRRRIQSTDASSKSAGGNNNSGNKTSPKKETPKKKERKEAPKDQDRYHNIKKEIDALNRSLTRLGKTEDRVYGKSKIKYLEKRLNLTKDQIKATEKYIAEIKKYMGLDYGNLVGINQGAEFDDNYRLTNYEEVLSNINKTYKDAIDEYNKSEQEDADKEVLEAAQKQYEEQKRILDQYEKTYELWNQENENLIDQINEQYDLFVKMTKMKVDLQIEFNENDKKLLEFLYDNIGNSADYASDKISNLTQQIGIDENSIRTYRKGISDILKKHNVDINIGSGTEWVEQLKKYMENNDLEGELTQEEADNLREFANGLIESYNNIKTNFQKIHQDVIDSIDEWNERLESQKEIYDRLESKLNHYRKIIDLTGKKMLGITGDDLKNINNSLINNAKNELASNKQIMDAYDAQRENAWKKWQYYIKKGDEDIANEWEKIYKDLDEKTNQATENYYASWEDALEKVNKKFQDSLDSMQEKYNDSFGSGLDWMTEQYDRRKTINELYLPDYEKYYQLNKISANLQKTLNNTSNPKLRQRILDLEKESNNVEKEGNKISQVGVDILAKRVALLQAEAELENAKNAKNAVRMTRDNEGNFSYTYTADNEAIDTAKEEYIERYHDLMEYDHNMLIETEETIMKLMTEYNDAIRQVTENALLSEEEKAERLKIIHDHYGELLNHYFNQEQELIEDQGKMREQDWSLVEELTGKKVSSNEDFIDSFKDTVLAQASGYENLEDLTRDWVEASDTLHNDAKQAIDDWESDIQGIYEEAGSDANDFKTEVNDSLKDVSRESNETKNSIDKMVNGDKGMKASISAALKSADEFDRKFVGKLENLRDKIGTLVDKIDDMLKGVDSISDKTPSTVGALEEQRDAVKDLADEYERLNEVQDTPEASSVPAGNGGGGDYISSNTGEKMVIAHGYGVNQSQKIEYTTEQEARNAVKRNNKSGRYAIWEITKYADGTSDVSKVGTEYVNYEPENTGGYSSNLTGLRQNATGGYTGDWGDNSGKLAILHRKEIVLNKEDTSNFLNAIGIVRSMKDFIDVKARNLNNMFNYNTIAGIGADTLEQQVHIEAVFPNAVDHDEIELAFNDLINSATQFVNRK